MTMLFADQERRRRKKSAAAKAASVYPIAHSSQASQSTVQVQQHAYSPSVPPVWVQQSSGHSMSPQPHISSYPPHPPRSQEHHPIYGSFPKMPQPHQYGQTYASPPLQPAVPYIGNPAISTAASPPLREGLLRSHWSRAERLASRSCQDLSAQLSSSANKSVNMANKSATMVTSNFIVKPTTLASRKSVQALNQGAALCDRISSKLDVVLTSIDDGLFSGHEQDLFIQDQPPYQTAPTLQPVSRDRSASLGIRNSDDTKGSNVFNKVWLYSNSRLPPHLPPFKVYMPTYPLLCLAATYSERVYTSSPARAEAETHVPADWRSGTKAMVLKSLPIDDMNTIVFAIRGSQTFMDWAVNSRSEPTSPEGFLDDAGNLCHAGFLYVARKMIKPVADRLRVLLQENPARSNASLLITGHSAGGAVAALLYSHMMSTNVQSELSYLTGFFKRVHCVTFGAPPVTLLPLKKSADKQHRKTLFYSIINEGDPVPRADKAVVKSLLRLYSSAVPSPSVVSSSLASLSKLDLSTTQQITPPGVSTAQASKLAKSKRLLRPSKTSLQSSSSGNTTSSAPAWPIVPCTLSSAGRLIVLRNKVGGGEDDVEAVTVEDEMLRRVVYGDPLKHMMRVYRRRIELIATHAVTARQF